MASQPTKSRSSSKEQQSPFSQIREIVISLGISLIMAFIAKAYVVEAYVIPTGSMGPTLLGKHMRYDGPQTGYDWAVETWHKFPTTAGTVEPYPIQGGTAPNGQQLQTPHVADPMTVGSTHVTNRGLSDRAKAGSPLPQSKKTRAGDRILVQKYLYDFFEPERYDVVVFKNPTDAQQNYIKRLIALPNEHVWLLDGDVFTAPVTQQASDAYRPARDADWAIQRKPFAQQKGLWQRVFSSEYSPIQPADTTTGRQWFQRPWLPSTDGWTFNKDGVYEYEGTQPTAITWDTVNWPIDDWTYFNDFPGTRSRKFTFPVGDVRVRAAVIGSARFIIQAHGETFRATFSDVATTIESRKDSDTEWTEIAKAEPVKDTSKSNNYEFWFADQAVSLVVNNKPLIKQAPIAWSASERLTRSTGLTLNDELIRNSTKLTDPYTYEPSKPNIRIELDGPAKLYRVGVDRDLYYRSALQLAPGRIAPAYGGTPQTIATLKEDHFWLIGDNSTNSLDARQWQYLSKARRIDPWVADQVDPTVGVINRDLLLGKAFFVYWPAVYSASDSFFIPVPDFGRMRFID